MTGDIGTDPMYLAAITLVETTDGLLLTRPICLLICTHVHYFFPIDTPSNDSAESVTAGKLDFIGSLVDTYTFECWVLESAAAVLAVLHVAH